MSVRRAEEARMHEKLTAGDTFPTITLELLEGGTLTLPAELPTPLAVVLFYRGHW
jgi:hypothetical protein